VTYGSPTAEKGTALATPASVTSADLKESLRLPGCALCRVRADAERRHLRFFIWEGTNDGPATRG